MRVPDLQSPHRQLRPPSRGDNNRSCCWDPDREADSSKLDSRDILNEIATDPHRTVAPAASNTGGNFIDAYVDRIGECDQIRAADSTSQIPAVPREKPLRQQHVSAENNNAMPPTPCC